MTHVEGKLLETSPARPRRQVVSVKTTKPHRRRRWPVVVIGVVLLIGAAAVAILSLPQFGGKASGERLTRMRANPHFHDGRFVNDLPPAGLYVRGRAGALRRPVPRR